MPDQTPVTDDDRKAHEWCDMAEYYSGTDDIMDATARAIRAHVPAPPATLAEQILDIAGYISSDFGAYADDLTAIADRAEAVEKELAGRKRDYIECQEELLASEEKLKDTRLERDEARADEASDSMQQQAKAWADIIEHPVFDGALGRGPGNGLENALYRLDSVHTEVERLTRGRTSKESITVAADLSDPTAVPAGEAWIVEYQGESRAAVKDGDDTTPWNTVAAGGWLSCARNTDINLLHRLVPAPRVITNPDELEQLAATSIIRDGRGWPGGITDQGVTMINGFCLSDEGVLEHGPVTVLWEPEVTA